MMQLIDYDRVYLKIVTLETPALSLFSSGKINQKPYLKNDTGIKRHNVGY